MYKSIYGFEFSGFKMAPDRNLRFRHDSYTKVFETFLRSIRRGNGFAVLTGAPGTGKTSLIDDLAARLERDGCIVGKVAGSLVDADDLPRLVGFAFGLQAETLGKARLLTLLKEQLVGRGAAGNPIILVIDEAQDLSVPALDELHLLFDLIARRGRVVQIVLAGQERLWERLKRPECDQILRLVVASGRLLPLSLSETHAYVGHALKHMGWTGDPEISADALRLLHQRTGGVPRLINLTMGRLLLNGSLGEVHTLDLQDTESVLEQLAEVHPELRLDKSNRQQPLHPATVQPIEPLGALAEEDGEPQEPSLRERYFSVLFRNKHRDQVQSLLNRFRNRFGLSWKWALAALAAAVVSLDVILGILSDSDRSVPSASHEKHQGEQAEIASIPAEGQTAPERAETPLDPSAYPKPVEVSSQLVAPYQGGEEVQNRVPDLVQDESAIAEPKPVPEAHPDRIVDAPTSVRFKGTAETADALSSTSERTEGPAQIEGWEPTPEVVEGPFTDVPATANSEEAGGAELLGGAQTEGKEQTEGPKPVPSARRDDLPAGTQTLATSSETTGAAQSDVTQIEGQGEREQPDPELTELLAQAEQALSNNKLTVPSGDNAYAYYQAVLALDPANAQAGDGMRRILERYRQLAQQRLNQRDRRGARLYASRGLKIWPRDPTLLAIKKKTAKRRVVRTQHGRRGKAPEIPEVLKRVEKWFRSRGTNHSEFLEQ